MPSSRLALVAFPLVLAATARPAPADPMNPPMPATRPAAAVLAATRPANGTGPVIFPDAIELKSAAATLAVSPGAGRAVWFGPADGDNLLWVADADDRDLRANARDRLGGTRVYDNLGGDKVWPTIQALWDRAYGAPGWPPDGTIDGAAWTVVERGDRRVVIESAPGPHLGVVVRRAFELDDDEPVVRITNTLRRVRANVFPLTVWSVTQVVHPRAVVLGTDPRIDAAWSDVGKPRPQRRDLGGDDAGGASLWEIPAETKGASSKAATAGGWVAGVYDDVVFLQSTAVAPDGSYPDGTNAQAYLGEKYLELETLSPQAHPAVGESLENVVTWRLVPREGRSAEQLLPVLRGHVEEDR